jgi:hypothetical protein
VSFLSQSPQIGAPIPAREIRAMRSGAYRLNPLKSGRRFRRITPILDTVLSRSLNPLKSGRRFRLSRRKPAFLLPFPAFFRPLPLLLGGRSEKPGLPTNDNADKLSNCIAFFKSFHHMMADPHHGSLLSILMKFLGGGRGGLRSPRNPLPQAALRAPIIRILADNPGTADSSGRCPSYDR